MVVVCWLAFVSTSFFEFAALLRVIACWIIYYSKTPKMLKRRSILSGEKRNLCHTTVHATGCRVTSRGIQNRPLKHYHTSLSPTQLSVAMKCFYFLFFKITRTECWLIQKYTFLLEVITLSLMLLNIHLLTATRKSNYLAWKEQEVLK